jgi:uncharacterized protein YkwD
MTTPTPIHFSRAAIVIVAALALTLVAPSPAHAVTVELDVSRASAPPTIPVTFSASAKGAPSAAPVALQRRYGSGTWSTVKTGGRLSSSGTYSLSMFVPVGTYQYRLKVGSSAYSAAETVSGNYGRNISTPATGAPFTLIARLPWGQARPVVAQVQVGSTWSTRGRSNSSSAGLVGIRTYLTSSSYMRMYAPATSSLAAWAGPRRIVSTGTDPVIKKILDDTNAHRRTLGRSPLKLHPTLNRIAGNWAYYMHQKCEYKHNPTYTSGYPWGWRKAAENVAAGRDVLSVVTAWIESLAHRANLLGDYTHVGIGYYEGSNCYGRYWVQNFAKY